MQNPNLDTEWNDVLRKHGILPKKEKEITEDQLISLMTDTIDKYEEKQKNAQNVESYTLDQLDEAEDDISDDILSKIRSKRLEEMKNLQMLKKFGSVIEITASMYVEEVNKAGEDIWVVLHLYQDYIPICKIINEGMSLLAAKFPTIKFVKGIASECIKVYPDKNVPTIFIFKNAVLIQSIIGPTNFAAYTYKNCSNCLEWTLSTIGVLKTDIINDPYSTSKHNKTQISASIFGRGLRKNLSDDSDE